MIILGISAFFHDSAAALLVNGEIIAAAQEERFSRKKNDKEFPYGAIKYCLREGGIELEDVDALVFYDKSFLKFERILETYYAFAPKGILSFFKSIPEWIGEKIFIKKIIRKELKRIGPYKKKKLRLLFSEHHLSHAASAFFVSGFSKSAILTIDGVGEWATTTICKADGNKIELIKECKFPHSVGLLYSAFTYYLGFKVNSDEYKLMGLAPYGNPEAEETKKYIALIKTNLVSIFDDGSIFLDQEYFTYAYRLRMTNDDKFEKLFGFKRREPESEFTPAQLNLAYAIQEVTEEIVFKLAFHTREITGLSNLSIAGGVALNCVANGKLQSLGIFENIFIQPAAGDAGGALGAALAGHHIFYDNLYNVRADRLKGSYLGPSYSDLNIQEIVAENQPIFKKFPDDTSLNDFVARVLASNHVVGWFQGRMEFGPRALGNRSILANAHNRDMQKTINLRIKFREGFRPFAPAVLEEDASNYFEMQGPSPFMLFVYPIQAVCRIPKPENFEELSLWEKLYTPRSEFQGVTHIDYSARVQTVSKQSNEKFYLLLQAYKSITGHSVLINTSLNINNEPIVCTPEEAFNCFKKTAMDVMVINNYVFVKEASSLDLS